MSSTAISTDHHNLYIEEFEWTCLSAKTFERQYFQTQNLDLLWEGSKKDKNSDLAD